MKNKEKNDQYAQIIGAQIAEMFDEDSQNYIDPEDLAEGDNVTHFFHALTNMVPTMLYNRLIKDDKNMLEFNHIANQLVFQYIKSESKD